MVEQISGNDAIGQYLAGLVQAKKENPFANLDVPVFDSSRHGIIYEGGPFEETERVFGVDHLTEPDLRLDTNKLMVRVFKTRFPGVLFVETRVNGGVDKTLLEIQPPT